MSTEVKVLEKTAVYELSLNALNGAPMDEEMLKDKLVLAVNVASKCGYTKQYKELQQLYADFRAKGLVVLGVPCNQFGGQEPGSAEEIQEFCNANYDVTFPLLEKQDVKGEGRSSLYNYLISSPVGAEKDVNWNFEKFLIRQDGKVVARFASEIEGDDPDLVQKIEKYLA
jgi:glutathione peroxidase